MHEPRTYPLWNELSEEEKQHPDIEFTGKPVHVDAKFYMKDSTMEMWGALLTDEGRVQYFYKTSVPGMQRRIHRKSQLKAYGVERVRLVLIRDMEVDDGETELVSDHDAEA